MLAIFFGLETLQITQKMRSLEAQLGTFETEKTKLEQNHQHDLEDLKSSLNVLYAELDDSSQKLTDEKNQKESVMLELEKEKALVETMQQSVNLLDEELIEMKEKFRAVNSELKV
jgi:peptidoglycan hydrolase CwlO-like protein